MIRWFAGSDDCAAAMRELEPWRAHIETFLTGHRRVPGFCCNCDRLVKFRRSPALGDWFNLRDSFVCPRCGATGRERLLQTALRREIGAATPRTLLFEQVTALSRRVRDEFPFVHGCEYLGPDARPGEVRSVYGRDIRHEDMTELSVADGALDLIVHSDVLEHVADFHAGLRDCARALAPGGRMLFAAPFFDLAQHLVRAEVVDGKLVHHLEPGYHGNPMSAEGSLVFVHFGWPLLQDVVDAGFARAEIGLLYDPFQGIVSNNNPYPDGLMWPVVFRATR